MEESYKTDSQIAGWSLMIIFVLVLVISICISQGMKKGKRLKIPSPEYYRHVEAQEAVEQYHAIALERVKEQAKMVIENFFPEMERHTDVYSYLETVGDKVRNKYYKYLGIPPNEQQSTPDDLTEEDGPTETTV